MEEIPEEFKQWRGTKWNKVFNDWFYDGLNKSKWRPKPGIDAERALTHIGTIMGSWEPSHEHKEAAVAYLLSLWFEDVTYTRKSHA